MNVKSTHITIHVRDGPDGNRSTRSLCNVASPFPISGLPPPSGFGSFIMKPVVHVSLRLLQRPLRSSIFFPPSCISIVQAHSFLAFSPVDGAHQNTITRWTLPASRGLALFLPQRRQMVLRSRGRFAAPKVNPWCPQRFRSHFRKRPMVRRAKQQVGARINE